MQNKRQNPTNNSNEDSSCSHDNVKREGGYVVCQDCGLTLDNDISTLDDNIPYSGVLEDRQKNYEDKLKKIDKSALQDPIIKENYKKIIKLGKWYRDSTSNFTRQKRDIDLLKSYGINITQVQYHSIKKKYISYLKKFKKPFQNMILIFLAIIWREVKDITTIRIEKYIKFCNEIGHKINKKMLNNALLKVENLPAIKIRDKDSELKKIKTEKSIIKKELEKKLKEQIKFLLDRALNRIKYEEVKIYVEGEEQFENLKIQLQLLAFKLLKLIPYRMINSVNVKAFVSGFIYYTAQLGAHKRKVFTQKIIANENVSGFSATTIRKQYNYIKSFLGEPEELFQ